METELAKILEREIEVAVTWCDFNDNKAREELDTELMVIKSIADHSFAAGLIDSQDYIALYEKIENIQRRN